MKSYIALQLYLLITLAICLFLLGVLTSLVVIFWVRKQRANPTDYVTASSTAPITTIDDAGDEREEEKVLWRKAVLLGEKCKPPRFSGTVYYDYEGNRVPEMPGSQRLAFSPMDSMRKLSHELNK